MDLPHVNATKHKHYSRFYGEKQIKMVTKFYAEDLKYYGYTFKDIRSSKKEFAKRKASTMERLRRKLWPRHATVRGERQ